MKHKLTPLIFEPIYKSYLWGGNRLSTYFRRAKAPVPCAESWELSAHPNGLSVVSQGPYKGQTLQDLTTTYGSLLIGEYAPDPTHFPLLFKVIDAAESLSIQVHPNHHQAPRIGNDPKTEMWYVLACDPLAKIYAGLRPETTPATLHAALQANNGIDKHLVTLEPQSGQALFIPGGLVHAIGAGCLIYEVQQNSNTTYRLFDWNRTGPDGHSRPLHVEQGMQSIDWSLPPPLLITPSPPTEARGNRWSDLVNCPFFTVRHLDLTLPLTLTPQRESFIVLFVAQGHVELTSANTPPFLLPAGTSVLIPACSDFCLVTPKQPSTLLVTTLSPSSPASS